MDFDQVMNSQKNRLFHFHENKRLKFFFTKEILFLFGFFFDNSCENLLKRPQRLSFSPNLSLTSVLLLAHSAMAHCS